MSTQVIPLVPAQSDAASAVCNECIFAQTWSTTPAAEAAAVWHCYEKHPELWQATIGSDRKPQDPRPETLGEWLA